MRALAASALPLLFCLAACGDLDARAGVYVEDGADGALSDRSWAYRLTVFEYGTRVGGFIEYFALDGTFNTAAAPYFVPSQCEYFGDGPLRDRRFVVAADGIDGTRFTAQARFEPRRRDGLAADVVQPAGTADAALTIRMIPDGDVLPERACPEIPETSLVPQVR